MRKISSYGKLLLLMLISFTGISVMAQYTRSTFATTYSAISTGGGAISIVGGTATTNFTNSSGSSNVDDGAALIPLPFNFTYNSVTYTASTNYVNIGTNGFISFITTNTNASKITGSDNLYTTGTPNIAIAGWMDDLALGSGQVLYQTQGSVGSRTFTVQFTNYPTYFSTSTSTINFQIILYETTNVIELKYGTATNLIHNTNESASVGIEWGSGGPGNFIDAITGSSTVGTSLNNSEAFPVATRGFRFTPGAPTAITAGTYNVGVGQTYPSLTEAIADVNHRGVSGAVNFNCVDASYPVSAGNIYPLIIAPISGTSATNTVTFTGNGSGNNALLSYRGVYAGNLQANSISIPTISALSNVYLVGSDYVTFRNFNIDLSAAAPGTTAFGTSVSRGVYVVNASATNGATFNTIQNVSVSLARTNTNSVGIHQNTATAAATSAAGANSNNRYYNLNISNVYSGVYLQGTVSFPDLNCEIGVTGGGTTTIGGAAANDIGNGSTQTWGIRATNQSGSGGTFRIFNCEVRNVTVTGAVACDGIFLEAFTGVNEVYNNNVHDIRNTSTSATSNLTGIRATHNTTGTNAARIFNNFVYAILSGYTGTASATRQIRGIFAAGTGGGSTQSYNIDFNSVRIDGSSTPNISSTCFDIATSSGPVINVRNNVFANFTGTQSGVAKHFAVASTSNTAVGGTGSVWNNNVYFIANAANGFTGTGSSTDRVALSDWSLAYSQDGNSRNQNPQFISATDLHINTSSATPVESNASYFSGAITWVGADYDGNTRNATTPDIGADEGTFVQLVLNDLQATAFVVPTNGASVVTGATVTPQASFTNNGLNAQTGVTVRYRILDPSSTEVYNQTGTITSIASGATTTVTFPVSGALTTGGAYTLIATAELAGDAVTANDQINGSITVLAPLAGDYLVGTSQTTPFNNLATAVARLNLVGVSAATRFLLTDASYDLGTTALQINAIAGSSATNTFTLKPNTGVTATITNNVSSASIILNGADNVIIDGSNGNTANSICPASAASRDLTIANTNAGTSSAVIWLQTTAGSDAATSNIVRNCNINGNSSTTTLVALGSGSASISVTSTGTGNNNNAYVNNNITRAQYGIYTSGASAVSKNTGTTISQNLINSVSPNNVGIGGILAGFENNITISGNIISEINGTSDRFGISAGLGNFFIFSTVGATEVTNASITLNLIGNIIGSGTNSAIGIGLGTATSGTSTIANNMVYGVSSNPTSSDFAAGIAVAGGAGSVTNVYHNTVSMQGTVTGATAATVTSACFAVTAAAAPTLDIRNNIFSNTQVNNSGTTMRFAAIALNYSSTAGNYTGLTSNNNVLFSAGSLGTYTVGITGGIAGTNRTTFAAWTTETGRDGASKNILPVYQSATDLRLVSNNSTNVNNIDGFAASGTGISTDIECETRNGSTPDIGADEFTPPSCTGAVGGTASGSTAFCASGTPAITATGFSSGLTSTYQWYSSTNAADYTNNTGTIVSGQTNPASLVTGVVSTTTYYWLQVGCGANTPNTANSNMITVTINPLPAAVSVTGAGTFCSSTTINASNGNDGTIYFQGTTSGGTSTATPATSAVITSSGTYYFRAQSAAGCWSTEGSAAVTIQADPGITGTNASICAGGSGTIAASAANSCTIFVNSGTTLNGTLTAATDPIALRLGSMTNSSTCAFDVAVTRNYRAQQFQVSVTGNYVFDMTASSLSDNMAYIVTGPFTPGSCASGTFVRGDDDDGTSTLPRLGAAASGVGVMPLTAGVTYTLITLNYSSTTGTASGTYTWTITPPAGGQIMLPSSGTIQWYTAASGGTAIGTGSPFNPVGVAGSGLANTNTPGTTTYYAACSNASACRVPVTFTINPNYTVTASAGSNGSISPAGVTTLTCLGTGSQTYTITPDACYSVADVLVNGSSVGAVTSYTFNNVASNQTISASFVLNTYNITASAGTGGSISPAGTVNVNCGSNQSFTISPDPCYSIADVLVDGVSVGAVSSYTFTNVTAAHTISASFTLNTYTITVTAGANGSITPGTGSVNCGSNATYTITADPLYNIDDVIVDGVSQGAIGSYTFTNVQTTHTISASFVLAACINNNFSGTGNWTDGTRWSCGAPPNAGDNVTILSGSNVTLNTDFTVAGTFSMQSGTTMTVSPDRTFSVSGSANFNGQSVTFKSDATGYGSLGQVTGTLSGASNVTVERFIPNVGFRSWRLLSVPTSGSQTIRQSWQENNAPLANNVPGFGTLITGGGNNTGASQALGFDFSGPNTSMLFWNNSAWGNVSGTLGALSARQAYFLFVRGDRSKGVTGLTTDAGSTTLRSNGTIYTGNQVISASNAFSLIPNLYPSAINFTGLNRIGVANNFTIWDSKTQVGNQLGRYVTFSGTNSWEPNIGTVSYPANVANTTIESGQAFFVNGGAGATITLVETAKTSASANGNLGLRPVKREKLVTALLASDGMVLDGNTVVFDAVFANEVDADDAQKMGNPGANFGIESSGKLLSVEGRQPAAEQDAIQFRMWNINAGTYELSLKAGRITEAGGIAILEDRYTGILTPLELNGETKVSFTVDANAASKAANRFRVVFAKAGSRSGTYSIAPNPVEGGVMNVVLKSQQAGRHTIKVLSAQGQLLSTRVIEHAGGNGNQQISLPAGLSRGAYLVEFISPDKTRTVQTLFVNKK